MSARAAILAALRAASVPAAGPRPPASPQPTPGDLAQVFLREATAAAATVAVVAGRDEVPAAVAAFLAAAGLPPRVRLGATAAGAGWPAAAGIETRPGTPQADGEVLVTGCLAAIADVGAVVLATGPDQPAESAFLAETHVVVVARSRLVAGLDQLWPLLNAHYPGGALPRTVNIIRGPSRTADLGVPSRVGVHGPRRVHVVLVEAE